ncbi:MAG: hypothetical protein ACFB51_12960 [Anaerolineae bacterium]
MAKSHRGKVLRRLPSRGRGICPDCGRTGVKLLYSQGDVKVCKHCR